MPTISTFYGIIIRMFFKEHAPPHFHAQYGEYKAAINIETLEVLDWAELHRDELLSDWEKCCRHHTPEKIEPLP